MASRVTRLCPVQGGPYAARWAEIRAMTVLASAVPGANRGKILGHSPERKGDRHEGATAGHRSRPRRKAVFASDEQVDPLTLALMPAAEFHRLWGADQAPTFPDEGGPTAQASYFPPVGGYRFGFFTVPPGTAPAPADLDL